jgi:hypothetical protein
MTKKCPKKLKKIIQNVKINQNDKKVKKLISNLIFNFFYHFQFSNNFPRKKISIIINQNKLTTLIG